MATRSRIAMEQEDGSVLSVYCHSDGYIEYNGFILHTHYQDPEKVKELIALGDLSVLGERVHPTGPHGFNYDRREKGVTVAYGRDRGEDDVDPRKDESVAAFFSSDIEEYGYLFTQEGEWLAKTCHNDEDPVPLNLVISGVIEF